MKGLGFDDDIWNAMLDDEEVVIYEKTSSKECVLVLRLKPRRFSNG